MTIRNLKKELIYSTYADMENGADTKSIDYPSLIGLLEELLDRIELLENETLPSPSWGK